MEANPLNNFAVAMIILMLVSGCSKSDWKAKLEEDANRGLPKMIDSEIQAIKVKADAGGLTFYLKMVNYPATSIRQAYLNKAQEGSARQWCASEDKWRLDQGMSVTYVVSGSDDVFAGSYIISKGSCQ